MILSSLSGNRPLLDARELRRSLGGGMGLGDDMVGGRVGLAWRSARKPVGDEDELLTQNEQSGRCAVPRLSSGERPCRGGRAGVGGVVEAVALTVSRLQSDQSEC